MPYMSILPIWAEIDLKAIAWNVREVRRITKPAVQILAVVKANAYGHGAIEVSKQVLANGASWLGVARLAEALAIRKAGIKAPVLIMGYTPFEQLGEVIRNDLTQVVYAYEMAVNLSEVATQKGHRVKVHLKIDTGMGRLGLLVGSGGIKEVLAIARLPYLEIEGICTHFATADSSDKSFAYEQLARFLEFTLELSRQGLEIPVKHAANSAALMEMPESHLDLVRPGIMIYGLYPSLEVNRGKVFLKPAMSLKARVALVKEVPAGFRVSYGCTYMTEKPTILATLPVGYADGYSRLLSSKGKVLIHGQQAPVLGRICMDYCIVDVGHIPDVKIGDEVVFFGCQGNEEILVDEIAASLGTISYEVVCLVGSRVPRIYLC